MGAIAAGKVNASEATEGMRIIVKVSADGTVTPSRTKTGEGVQVARIIEKGFRAAGRYEARGKYVIHTSAGSFDAAPIQTMWLAPEDPAGIKRAYAEALIEDAARPVAEPTTETVPASEEAGAAPAALTLTEAQIEENAAEVDALSLAQAEAARTENEAPGGIYHGTVWASPTPRRALHAQMVGRVLRRQEPELVIDLPPLAAGKELVRIADLQDLTLNSHAGKVGSNSKNDAPEEIEMAQNLTHDEARNYPLSTGETADLIALVSSVKPSDWVQATEAQPVGTVVYAYAMGELRRGVVVKNTPTKTLVALTTAAAAAPGGTVRVQTATELHTTVYVAPAQEAEEPEEDEALTECPECGGPLASDGVCADDTCGADEEHPECAAKGCDIPEGLGECRRCGAELVQIEEPEDLTLNSHAGKVDNMNNDASTEAPTVTRAVTGSAVVQLLERVHERIRQNHPEVPAVVMVTGSGADLMGQKWGHFRPRGWMTRVAEEGAATHLDEMFMAGETLAKGARQVLQTMLHESAHALAEKRGEKDTSRQGRWHNKTFLKTAREMGLDYTKGAADKSLGFSAVTLTEATLAEYADLLDELDAEIHLMVRLPAWLGGGLGLGGTEGGEDEGGEQMGKKPTSPAAPNTNNIKCVCDCEEPSIIRMSRKVLDKGLVRCDDCEALFHEAL